MLTEGLKEICAGGIAMATWRTLSIFVSSTFQDMHVERDLLRDLVFPELEERLRDRSCHLEVVDLRWGTRTLELPDEAQRELKILSVCLDEIERSRPFFVAMIGDRYGWVPPKDVLSRVAHEQGLAIDSDGMSVTAFEIEFGALSASPPARPFLYLRNPLPQAASADDGRLPHAGEAQGAEAAAKLSALKRRLETSLSERTRHYSAHWDDTRRKVVGLESFGQMVLEDLWRELDAETSRHSVAAPPTVHDEDRALLASFVEDRSRSFVGRADVEASLLSAATNDESPSVVVTLVSGTGKSALFARLYNRLNQQDGMVVLGHSAEMGPRGGSVDAMIERWTEELCTRLGLPAPSGPRPSPEEMDATFARHLASMGGSARVVLLIDALDRFEPSQRARYLTWLPEPRPTNVRVIATGAPSDAVDILADRLATVSIDLPPLSTAEAKDIAIALCRRYHRDLDPNVLATLLAKVSGDGSPSHGSPLWLTLAVEQLNLVRGDDYARIERVDDGSDPEERLTAMLAEAAASFPPDTPSLLLLVLAYLDQIHTPELVGAFSTLVALGRQGWRESDLRVLVPAISGVECSDLDLARLRRGFRTQLVQRSTGGFWSFSYEEMRRAVLQRYAADRERQQEAHRAMARYLETLAPEDALRGAGLMHHLLAGGLIGDALRYFADELGPVELDGAVNAVADRIVNLEARGDKAGTGGLTIFSAALEDESVRADDRFWFAVRLMSDVDRVLERRLTVAARRPLLEVTNQWVSRLLAMAAEDGIQFTDTRIVAGSHRLAQVLSDLGERQEALQRARDVVERTRGLVDERPGSPSALSNLALSHFTMGQLERSQGDTTSAVASFEQALRIMQDTVAAHPDEPLYESGLSAINSELGQIRFAEGRIAEARSYFEGALTASERAVSLEPKDPNWQGDLATSLTAMGGVLEVAGELTEALERHRQAFVIRNSLANRSPDDASLLEAYAISCERIGRVLAALNDLPEAAGALSEAVRVRDILARADPSKEEWGDALTRAEEEHAMVEMARDEGLRILLGDANQPGSLILEVNPADGSSTDVDQQPDRS
jgi:tetratricopeptide (TPR) repeat protein